SSAHRLHSPQTPGSPTAIDAAAASLATTSAITLTNQEINAWLEYRLPMWAANRGAPLPSQLGAIRYWTDAGRPVLAAQLTIDGSAHIVSVIYDLVIDDDGRARLEL